jgi:Tol biopolymer transport system component/predicted Ser/Thr protein kinase
MPLSVGDRLGPYEILAPIGAGGMGEVYKARDTRLDRIVAVKVSKTEFSERFEREARAIATLNHPHICTLYDVGPNYLVMEFVEGVALKGPLSLDQALKYAAEICDALDAAHKKNITHRDLKPANILVTKAGVKLLDFGLAKVGTPLQATEGTMTMALTGKGEILGTFQYMSPEQINGQDAGPESDLFSFGLVLYEMLTGKRAFDGSTPASVIAAILERPAPSVADVAPPALDRVLKRCLEKDPEERWQSARDLKAELEWIGKAPESEKAAPLPSRFRWIAAAVMLVLGAFGGWAVAHFRQPPADERVLRFQIEPPEGGEFSYGATTSGIALSPDGRTAAYVASSNGKSRLWVRPLDETAARVIPGTEGAGFPFWSPDSRSIAFGAGDKLQRVDLAGGPPLTICGVSSLFRGGAWAGDGQIIFGTYAGLFQVSASGGTPSPLKTFGPSRADGPVFWPQMLPGGHFLYVLSYDKPENDGVYAASLAKPSEAVRLLSTETNALYAPGSNGKGYLLWQRGSTLLAQDFDVAKLRLAGEPHPLANPVAELFGQMTASVSANGLLLYGAANPLNQFTWVDRAGKKLSVVGEPFSFGPNRLSPDGRRLATTRASETGSDLWLIEVERGVASRFTFDSRSFWPAWSPDGRTILYSQRNRGLFRKALSGAGGEQSLTQSPDIQIPADWSRDGRAVLFDTLAPTRAELWVLPLTAEGKPAVNEKPRRYAGGEFSTRRGRFSPDTRWVAYQSDESGKDEIYVDAFPETHGKVQISTDGGSLPAWGPGGRELFYVSADNKLMAVSLKLGADSVEPSAPRELFPLPIVDTGLYPYDVAPDGQRFLIPGTPGQAHQPLTVIVNWPALLKNGSAR